MSALTKRFKPNIASLSFFKPNIDPSWNCISTNEKKKIVILGSGWGGYSMAKNINREYYDVTMISPRNHFLFTPLLASTTTGTLEFRCVSEPVRNLNKLSYHQSRCVDINPIENTILLRDSFDTANLYNINYDYLVYAIGARTNDFGIKGVKEHALFLKQIRDAMKIRDKIQELFERCSKPTTTREEKDKLLSMVIVGGGPTSIEYAAELYDWLMEDAAKMFPDLIDMCTITLLEASDNILSGFGADLAEYTITKFRKRKIRVLTNSRVIQVEKDYVELSDGYKINYGLVLWATGIMSQPLTDSLGFEKSKSGNGRIIVDEYLKCISYDKIPNKNIYCIGDCADTESIGALPPTAQVAHQQGKYLAKTFNYFLTKPYGEFNDIYNNYNKTFGYTYKGSMAYIGSWRGVINLPHHNDKQSSEVKKRLTRLQGIRAWLFWRSAYFTMLTSTVNRILVPMYWFKAWVFGRDFSRF
eukprot:8931_1